MKIETLNERIVKAQEKVEKKQKTITKKTASIEKKTAMLQKLEGREKAWMDAEIKWLREDIERLKNEIPEIENTIENYKKMLSGEMERQTILTKEIPENMRRMQEDLVKGWDEYDRNRRDRLMKAYKELDYYRDFFKKYSRADWNFKDLTDEQIHQNNLKDAENLILNLIDRVKDITGEITDWAGIHATAGTWGYTVLNGFVVGKEGRCKVESIEAGGYNIQRYHIRVLVKPLN